MKVIFRGRRAVFSGEVGASLFVAGAAFVKFWQIAGARNVVFFHTKCISKMGRLKSPKQRVRDDDLSSDHPWIVLGYPPIILESSIYWRQQFKDFPLTS